MSNTIKKIAFVDGADFIKDKILTLLNDKYNFVIDKKYPDYIFYSVFGEAHIDYDCVRIFCTGENCRADFNFADYAITFDYLEFGKRHLRYPLYLCTKSFEKCLKSTQESNKYLDKLFERDFCSFVVSNGKGDKTRELIFDALNAYRRVDSGGKYRNNIGTPIKDKLAFISGYKFNIACENSKTEGYITEKIFDAKAARSVPIYYGDTSITNCNEYNLGTQKHL